MLKFSYSATDNGYSCEKGKPLEKVGRKASDPVMMGSGVAQQLDKFSNEAHFSQEKWAFLLPIVCKFDGFDDK